MLGRLGEIILELVRFKENLQVLNVLYDLLVKMNGRDGEEVFRKLRLLLRDEVVEKVSTFLSIVTTLTLPKTRMKRTKDCFSDEARYYFRSNALDTTLPENQEEGGKKEFSVCELKKPSTFIDIVKSVLKRNEATPDELQAELIKLGHIVTLPQIEDAIERTEKGEKTGLLTNGYGNFFFVLNNQGGVSVVVVGRDARRWHVYLSGFGNGRGWRAGRRFFFSNLDTSDS